MPGTTWMAPAQRAGRGCATCSLVNAPAAVSAGLVARTIAPCRPGATSWVKVTEASPFNWAGIPGEKTSLAAACLGPVAGTTAPHRAPAYPRERGPGAGRRQGRLRRSFRYGEGIRPHRAGPRPPPAAWVRYSVIGCSGPRTRRQRRSVSSPSVQATGVGWSAGHRSAGPAAGRSQWPRPGRSGRRGSVARTTRAG